MTKQRQGGENFVSVFREAAPYVHAHRGKTAVIAFGGEALQDSQALGDLVNDLALLHALGLRLVVVHGARPQVNARLAAQGAVVTNPDAPRVTDEAGLAALKDAVGTLRIELEGRLSMGLANSPMANARLRVASGNFVSAHPMGVVDGVDHRHTGVVRRVDAEGIRQHLDSGAIVLLGPIGYAVTGGVFNLTYTDVAAATASALRADKLVLLVEGADPASIMGSQLALDRAGDAIPDDLEPQMAAAVDACLRALESGVQRAHLVPRRSDGALLTELFSRAGAGAMITASTYEDLRRAESRHVGGILRLIRPLAEAGNLVERPREMLKQGMDDFIVAERDGMVVACAACHLFVQDGMAELAAVAVHPDYRHEGRGEQLLEVVERRAREAGMSQLFALTTRAEHWFLERGFAPGAVEALPAARASQVDTSRGSHVLIKPL